MNLDYRSPKGERGLDARAAGFALLARLNRWLIAGAAATAGMLSLVASDSFHEKSKLATVAPQSSNAGSLPAAAPQNRTGPSPSIQPAPAPVSVASVPAPVVSGGS